MNIKSLFPFLSSLNDGPFYNKNGYIEDKPVKVIHNKPKNESPKCPYCRGRKFIEGKCKTCGKEAG